MCSFTFSYRICKMDHQTNYRYSSFKKLLKTKLRKVNMKLDLKTTCFCNNKIQTVLSHHREAGAFKIKLKLSSTLC